MMDILVGFGAENPAWLAIREAAKTLISRSLGN
jgi:hypothetical protein